MTKGMRAMKKQFRSHKTRTAAAAHARGGGGRARGFYLAPDAIAGSTAKRLGVHKRQIVAEKNAAVRLALAESAAVKRHREQMSRRGIATAAGGDGEGGPSQLLVVKNLVEGVSRVNIARLFSRFGLNQVLTEDGSLIAMVEMANVDTAQRAYNALQQSLFRGRPLYIEYGRVVGTKVTNELPPSRPGTKGRWHEPRPVDPAHIRVPKPLPHQSRVKMVVRNIPFQTAESELCNLFSTYGELARMTLPKKFNSQHKGYCFVQYVSEADAAKAFESLHPATHLYGRRLVLEWANDDETLEEVRARRATRFSSRTDVTENSRSKKSSLYAAIEREATGANINDSNNGGNDEDGMDWS